MKLHLAEFLRHLSFRSMTLIAEHGMQTLPAGDKNRRAMLATFRPMLHQASKFIFDSGADVDGDTTIAIKETAFAMLEDRRFHLPSPTTWIEDPFDSDPTGEVRNYYLAYEKENLIRVWVAWRRPYPANQNFYLCALPFIIDLDRPSLEGHHIPLDLPPGHPGHQPATFNYIQEMLGQADYAFRKFIVTLGAGGIEREEIAGRRDASGTMPSPGASQKQRGDYPYTIIRVPSEPSPSSGNGASSIGTRRRRHFVRGFVWGKNTRPREEQRWVAGYYRGATELGEVERPHYEVRGTNHAG